MTPEGLRTRIERLLNAGVRSVSAAGSGAAGSVSRITLSDNRTVIAKSGEGLDVEARSLRLLAQLAPDFPAPRVLAEEPGLLAMTDLGPSGRLSERGEAHAAEALAALHAVLSPDGRYGLEFDNTIGPLVQPNARSESWVSFYRELRVLHTAEEALREGSLPRAVHRRVVALASRLGDLVPDRPPASLIHGDVWGGNVIAAPGGERVAGFIDPSPYYAHAEVELAFTTLFGTFGAAFFDAYARARGLDAEFHSVRRAVYIVYPLLTHVRIYGGGGYAEQLDGVLRGLGL